MPKAPNEDDSDLMSTVVSNVLVKSESLAEDCDSRVAAISHVLVIPGAASVSDRETKIIVTFFLDPIAGVETLTSDLNSTSCGLKTFNLASGVSSIDIDVEVIGFSRESKRSDDSSEEMSVDRRGRSTITLAGSEVVEDCIETTGFFSIQIDVSSEVSDKDSIWIAVGRKSARSAVSSGLSLVEVIRSVRIGKE